MHILHTDHTAHTSVQKHLSTHHCGHSFLQPALEVEQVSEMHQATGRMLSTTVGEGRPRVMLRQHTCS